MWKGFELGLCGVVWTSPAQRRSTVVGSSCAGAEGYSDRSEGSAGLGRRLSVLSADNADVKQQEALHFVGLSLTHVSEFSVLHSPLRRQSLRW